MENREPEVLLVDEVISLLERAPENAMIECLSIMYNNIKIENYNPLELSLLFVKGLKKNMFFDFVELIGNFR